MIKLYNSELIKILPEHLNKDAYVQAFGYALDKQICKLLDKCKCIEIWSNPSNVDEKLLDYIAAELKTQYYSTDLEVDIKRRLVANTMVFYKKAGTKKSVEELVSILFGEGEVKEWHEYGGNPHHFKVITSNTNITDDVIEKMNDIIKRIKRKTARLDSVEISLSAVMEMFQGFSLHTGTYISLRQEG